MPRAAFSGTSASSLTPATAGELIIAAIGQHHAVAVREPRGLIDRLARRAGRERGVRVGDRIDHPRRDQPANVLAGQHEHCSPPRRGVEQCAADVFHDLAVGDDGPAA